MSDAHLSAIALIFVLVCTTAVLTYLLWRSYRDDAHRSALARELLEPASSSSAPFDADFMEFESARDRDAPSIEAAIARTRRSVW